MFQFWQQNLRLYCGQWSQQRLVDGIIFNGALIPSLQYKKLTPSLIIVARILDTLSYLAIVCWLVTTDVFLGVLIALILSIIRQQPSQTSLVLFCFSMQVPFAFCPLRFQWHQSLIQLVVLELYNLTPLEVHLCLMQTFFYQNKKLKTGWCCLPKITNLKYTTHLFTK